MALIVGLSMAVLLLVVWRRYAAAVRSMSLEAMRSDALGRLARGDSMEQILGILAATIHISHPRLRCSIRLTQEDAEYGVPATPTVTWPIPGSDGRTLASLLIEYEHKRLDDDERNLIERVAKLASIVIEHKTLHKDREYEASHDWLTGMANRRVFTEKINSLDKQNSASRSATVFFIDLDHFKQINDGFGHHVGDLFLREAAQRIRSCFASSDLVARMGGDEFTVLAEGLDPQKVAKICTRVVENFRRPFLIGELQLAGSVSIGVSSWPCDGDAASDLQNNADWALYEAKRSGRNQFRIYIPEMRRRATLRVRTEQLIRDALQGSFFQLVYQPQVDRHGRLMGLEALIRIRHPELGLIMPEEFISVAEEGSLITEIDMWVLSETCRQYVAWQRSGYQPVRIAVNISRASLADPALAANIRDTLHRSGIDPSGIQIELTESAALQGIHTEHETLRRLRDSGMSLALDDFGTGYSSLSCLHSLPVDTVKIDKSFVQRLSADENSLPFVRAIIGVAQALGLSIVAEGIETQEQMSVMCLLGCDLLQGFYISAPVQPSAIPVKNICLWEQSFGSSARQTQVHAVA